MERLKMSKISKFESDTSHVSDDNSFPKLQKFHFQTWQSYKFKGALFSRVDRFSLTCPCQKLGKNNGMVYYYIRCIPCGWCGSGSVIWDHSDHSTSKEPTNPPWKMIHKFICCSMMWVISDHWFWSSQRNPLIVKFDIWTLDTFLKSDHLNI